MSGQALEWSNLERLRSLFSDLSQGDYVTFAALMDDRKETQLFRIPVEATPDLYEYVIQFLEARVPSEGLPSGGRLRVRVRLWGPGGRSLGGVVIRIQPPRLKPRPRKTTVRPKRVKVCQLCLTLNRENELLRLRLSQAEADRRMLQDELSRTRRVLAHLREA